MKKRTCFASAASLLVLTMVFLLSAGMNPTVKANPPEPTEESLQTFNDVQSISITPYALSVLPMSGYESGKYFSKKSTGCTCHSSSSCPSSSCNCTSYLGSQYQCYGFANKAKDYVYGSSAIFTVANNPCGNTIAAITTYLKTLPAATHLRVNYGGHSIIVVSTSSTGVTIYDANGDGGNNCRIRYKTMTYAEFVSAFRNISYAQYHTHSLQYGSRVIVGTKSQCYKRYTTCSKGCTIGYYTYTTKHSYMIASPPIDGVLGNENGVLVAGQRCSICGYTSTV